MKNPWVCKSTYHGFFHTLFYAIAAITFRVILLKKNVATMQDNPSAIMNVVQSVQVMPAVLRTSRENPPATGSTRTKCLKTDMISDSMPPSSAWKMPWYAILIPAKTKLSDTMRMTKHIAIGALAGAIVLCGFYVIRFLLDTTLKTEEDVEKYMGCTVLASIPQCMEIRSSDKKQNDKMSGGEKNE